MDCDPRVFEFPLEALIVSGVPRRFPQPMKPQELQAWTLARLTVAAAVAVASALRVAALALVPVKRTGRA